MKRFVCIFSVLCFGLAVWAQVEPESPTIVTGKNFSGQTTPNEVADEYRNCNFSHPAPVELAGKKIGVRLFPLDDTPRTFVECNLVNCLPPPGSVLIRCNTTLRESMVDLGTTETLIVDSKPVEIGEWGNLIYGRTNPNTLLPEYKPTPLLIPCDPPEGTKDAKILELVRARDAALEEAAAKEAEAAVEVEAIK